MPPSFPLVPIPPGIAAPAAKPAAAKPAAASNFLTQPPFDPRMRSIADPLNSGSNPVKFDRGFMVWDVSYAASFGAGYNTSNALPYVNFLFNPSTVQASYQLSNTAAQAANMYGISTAGASVAYVSLQQQMSFTIMFDRTYEIWDQSTYAGSNASTMGCEADVAQMKQFTGMFAAANAYGNPTTTGTNVFSAPLTTGTYGGQTVQAATGQGIGPQQGLMLMIPSYVYFCSSPVGGGVGQYYGYIDAWSVQYTHYSNQMVPIRCVVDIEYTLLPNSSSATSQIQNGAVQNLQAYQDAVAGFTANGTGL